MFSKTTVRGSMVAAFWMPWATVVLLGLIAAEVHAQTLTTLCSFNGSDGKNPCKTLALIGNNLYGAAEYGGLNGNGVVFSLPVGGGTPTVLASFNGSNGSRPDVGVRVIGNILYGATLEGGADNDGTVFSLPISGGTPTVLASLNGSNGTNPVGLTLIDNTFYGATQLGGDLLTNHGSGSGVVFSIPVSGGGPTILAVFNGNNGQMPHGDLAVSGNSLFGTTLYGGSYNLGTVFSLPLSGGPPAVLGSFNGNNGAGPLAGLTVSDNMLYGTTGDGGPLGRGTVFSVPVSGGTPAIFIAVRR